MGAFFLFKSNSDIDLPAVEQVFRRKGFEEAPLRRNLKDWELWLYKKQLVESPNYLEDNDGYAVYVTGTVVYKGLGYTHSIKQLLTDFKVDSINNDKLLGNFCLLFWDGQSISFLTDALNVHHIFIDKKHTRFSTSFLALLASHTQKSKINKLAFFEKLATGYIISPDTLIEDIQQVDDNLKEQLTKECPGLVWTGSWQSSKSDYTFHDKGFEDSIRRQTSVLKSYFQQVDTIHNEYHGELGLSSGYDSRLLLASGCSFLSYPLQLHTHNTMGVHDFERSIAEEIAHLKNLHIRIVPTKHIEEHEPDLIHNILLEVLYFFDARCSYDMGAYSETYTGSYRKGILGKNLLSFNGIGGEIFRNHYFTSRQHLNTLEWMKAHLYYYYAEEALNDSRLFQHVHSLIISKLGERLQEDIQETMSFFEMRRYYSEIRMPDSDGINHNAQNQIAFYLTPFMETKVIEEALKATPYIGTHSKYQAGLIQRLDPALASIQSHYGFSFDQTPGSHIIYSILKGYIPDKFWNLCHLYLKKKGRGQHLLQSYNILKKRCDYLSTIEKVFSDFFPRYNWQAAMCGNAQKPTNIFLASFLHEFSNKISC